MILHTHQYTEKLSEHNQTLVFIHGLFGSLDNLGFIARKFRENHNVIQVDVRNHGLSPHDEKMTYPLMAQDILETLDTLQIHHFSIVGHSMGGKIAMALTALAPSRVQQVAVIDIAPVKYPAHRHDEIFAAIEAVIKANVSTRKEASEVMETFIQEKSVIDFLLKSFRFGQWLFNTSALFNEEENICGWEKVPAWNKPLLFIGGARSYYLASQYRDETLSQFPQARLHIIHDAGHWVHAEQPQAVIDVLKRFLR